jgi:hypothetical protein
MKTIVKVMLPMVAFALASAGAVSTNVAKDNVTSKPVITGFIQNGSITNCPSRSVDCSTVNTGFACMSSDATPKTVWLKNGLNQCIIDLYRPHQ